MFDIGFWELIVIFVVGLVVLGPERLPHAIRSVSRFVSSAKNMANGVKEEISRELKVQELHENLRKAEQNGMEGLSADLKSSVDELKQAAKSVQRPYAKEPAEDNASQSSPTTSSDMTAVTGESPDAPVDKRKAE
ncbi:Sec-independent protein translocase protein TatB [Vibrio sp. S4M6]|uniref:Sec-independent protein translocase protein TatB n=1 Tax=Vibrio sinus TaxID=2946865 RepID=UPI002029F022|nr:Sec-independent protein translocase protein TatB [Vibrio sinus]